MIKIKNGKIISNNKIIESNIYIKNGIIFAITDENLPHSKIIDAGKKYVSAGFIDTHVHGGGGADFMDENSEAVIKACDSHFFHGTTTILPTTLATDKIQILNAIERIKKSVSKVKGDIGGIHLEGPYFSASQCGAQNADSLVNPVFEDYNEIIEKADGFIKKMSFAPELPGALEMCSYLSQKNIACFAGHTDATFNDIEKAIDHGLKGITHFYSCTSTVKREKGFRIAGVVEAGYYFDNLFTEVIGDGCHLPEDLLKLIYKIKGPDKICLITDSMRAAGEKEGEYILGNLTSGKKCIVEDGVAKLPDKTAFAGSVATADRVVRVLKNSGAGIIDAVKMMTEVPAFINSLSSKGKLKEGYDADILIFDENINISKIIKKKNSNVVIYDI